MAVRTNIAADSFFIGDNNGFLINVLQDDGITPQDMTGWTLGFYIAYIWNGENVLELTGASIVIQDGDATNDQAAITSAAADFAASAEPGDWYEYALRRIDAGQEKVLALGTIHLTRAANAAPA